MSNSTIAGIIQSFVNFNSCEFLASSHRSKSQGARDLLKQIHDDKIKSRLVPFSAATTIFKPRSSMYIKISFQISIQTKLTTI